MDDRELWLLLAVTERRAKERTLERAEAISSAFCIECRAESSSAGKIKSDRKATYLDHHTTDLVYTFGDRFGVAGQRHRPFGRIM